MEIRTIGSNGGRRSEPAEIDVRSVVSDGERHRPQLGGHAASLRLHVRRAKAQHRPKELPAASHRTAHESDEKS